MREKSQDWHRIDIKSALEKRGITLKDLSRTAGLSPDALETTPDVIWPTRYINMPSVSVAESPENNKN
ncbi:helix-turn-helix domain-containing protein [Citrobacter sp. ANG330]|uniref:helix-turn-helix domain-containing protein n=1 Tax=Citrobacter sp. ANG330 TaxID=3048142 RepID=UPI002A3AF3BC|nr:helix-turn-helix domain-containing protein [Citrobacter amalonaticus]